MFINRRMMARDSGRPVKSIHTCFDVIEFLLAEDGGSLREVADGVGIARSTAHNHLTTLVDRGYVRKEGETYRVGLGFLKLGEHARTAGLPYEAIRGTVRDLATETGEEADFTVLENGRLVSIHHEVDGENAAGHLAGSTFHLHATAAGKAILAELPDERVEAILDDRGMPAITEHTITDRDELFADLELTRDRGFAVNDREYMEGYRSVAAAVRAPHGTLPGALCVGGPMYRNDPAVLTGPVADALLERVAAFESTGRSNAFPNRNWDHHFTTVE
jgi:DNA-binding IclR family transcriptional regulator